MNAPAVCNGKEALATPERRGRSAKGKNTSSAVMQQRKEPADSNVHRPWAVMQFAERVPMVKGRLDKSSSTATSYCWIVWRTDVCCPTQMLWIPPCRKRLERDQDYRVAA